MNSSDLPEFDKEVRELYRERNARPTGTSKGQPVKMHWLWAGLAVVLVSAAISAIVVSWLSPVAPLAGLIQTTKIPTPVNASEEVMSQLQAAQVNIFLQKPNQAGLAEHIYLPSEALGQGIALSRDGWILTTQAVVTSETGHYAVATQDGVHNVERIVLDSALPFAYVKISADNLPVLAFADMSNLATGQTVLLANSNLGVKGVLIRHLTTLGGRLVQTRSDVVLNSDIIPDRYGLDHALPRGSGGAPVVNSRGELIGLAAADGTVIPIAAVDKILDVLFTKREIHRPILGVNYIQANWFAEFTSTTDSKEGAVVTSIRSSATAARSAGIKEGDIIMRVNGEQVRARSLSQLLGQYSPGAIINLTIVRQKKEISVQVKLGEVITKATK